MPAVVGRVEGLNETLTYLKRFDEDALKAMNKELYGVMRGLVADARSLAPTVSPMSGWAEPTNGEWGTRLLFDPRAIKTGIRSKIGTVRQKDSNTKEKAYLLINANPAGAIYETAGRKTQGKGKNGKHFIRQIENDSGIVVAGKQGRIAWKAVYEKRTEVANKMKRVVDREIDRINGKLAA